MKICTFNCPCGKSVTYQKKTGQRRWCQACAKRNHSQQVMISKYRKEMVTKEQRYDMKKVFKWDEVSILI